MKWDVADAGRGPDFARTRVDSAPGQTAFTALEDSANVGYSVSFSMYAPIGDTYIMIPACAYDGNRLDAVRRKYPPMFDEDELGVDIPPRMTEAPRLARDGDSFMDVTTDYMTASCVCVLDKARKSAFMLLLNQQCGGLDLGVTLEQRATN